MHNNNSSDKREKYVKRQMKKINRMTFTIVNRQDFLINDVL